MDGKEKSGVWDEGGENSERQVALNTLSRYFAHGVGLVTGFFLTPFLIRTIGPARLGLRTLAAQALQFVGLASSAIGVSYHRLAAEHYARLEYAEMNRILSAGLAVSAISATLFVAGAAMAAWKADVLFNLSGDFLRLGRIVLLLTGTTTGLHILLGVWKSPVFIRQRYSLASSGQVMSTLGAALTVWLAFRWHRPSLLGWVVLDCGYRLGVDVLWIIPRCRRALPQMRLRLREGWTRAAVRRMVEFGGLNFLGQLGFLLYYATDAILISNLSELGPTRIVYYNVAQRWDPLLHALLLSFATVLTPVMTSDFALARRDRLTSTLLRATRYSLLLAGLPCLLLVTFAHPFLHFWVGPNFADQSGRILQLVMGAFFLSVPGIVAYEALIACGRLSRAVTALLIGGLVNLGLSILLVKGAGLGLLGIALGSVIPLTVVKGVCIPLWAIRAVGAPAGTYLRHGCLRTMSALIPVGVLAMTMRNVWTPTGLPTVLTQFALCALAYAVVVWRWGLETLDREKARALTGSLLRGWSARTR